MRPTLRGVQLGLALEVLTAAGVHLALCAWQSMRCQRGHMTSSFLAQSGTAFTGRRLRDQSQRARRFSLALSCMSIWALSAGCGSEDSEARASRDAGSGAASSDAGLDAAIFGARRPDAHTAFDSASDDAGELGSQTCGRSQHEPLLFYRNGQLGFQFGGARLDQGRVSARVASVEWGRLEQRDRGDYTFVPESAGAHARLELRAGADQFTIVAWGLSSFGVVPDDNVEMEWQYARPSVYEPSVHLTLYEGDRLAFSYVSNDDPPGGFSYELGGERCHGFVACGEAGHGFGWVSRAVILQASCGDSVELGVDEHGTLCGYDALVLDVRIGPTLIRSCSSEPFGRPTFILAAATDPGDGGSP